MINDKNLDDNRDSGDKIHGNQGIFKLDYPYILKEWSIWWWRDYTTGPLILHDKGNKKDYVSKMCQIDTKMPFYHDIVVDKETSNLDQRLI